jgi:hypothetical protein
VKIKDSFASWPVGGNGAWGSNSVGNGGFYIRGNDIQIIRSGASNSADYAGIKFATSKAGSSVTSWGMRLEVQGYRAENISNYGIIATNRGASEGVTIYNDYALHSVQMGLCDTSLSYILADASAFAEFTWNGIGGRRVHASSSSAPSAVPITLPTAPTIAPTSAPTNLRGVPTLPPTASPSSIPWAAEEMQCYIADCGCPGNQVGKPWCDWDRGANAESKSLVCN